MLVYVNINMRNPMFTDLSVRQHFFDKRYILILANSPYVATG
jgi:hypothetical protein